MNAYETLGDDVFRFLGLRLNTGIGPVGGHTNSY
jgi:hypothetical protein